MPRPHDPAEHPRDDPEGLPAVRGYRYDGEPEVYEGGDAHEAEDGPEVGEDDAGGPVVVLLEPPYVGVESRDSCVPLGFGGFRGVHGGQRVDAQDVPEDVGHEQAVDPGEHCALWWISEVYIHGVV